MQNDPQDVNRRIDTFLTKKHQQFPELALRPDEPAAELQVSSMSELFNDLMAGIKLQLQ